MLEFPPLVSWDFRVNQIIALKPDTNAAIVQAIIMQRLQRGW